MIKTSKEILAAPLESAANTYEKIVSSVEEEEESASPVQTPIKVITSNEPWFANKYKVAESEIERLSAKHESSIDEDDQNETTTTITSASEETKPYQQLQVIGDDYAWYSSHFTIADTDAKLGELYNKLSETVKQLDQRPSLTTVEVQPEPHEKLATPDYDQQALADTKETREKVHELAQLSKTLTTASQDEENVDEDGFQIVQHRKRGSSSTIHEKTSPTTTRATESSASPDIDLVPVVLHGHPSASNTVPSDISQTTDTTTTTSSSVSDKKKSKKRKKDKKEPVLFDAPVPTTSDANEEKAETAQTSVTEERINTTESDSSPSSATHDSVPIEQVTDEIKDEDKQKITDIKSEEQYAEPLSTSVMSDIEETKQIDDDKNDSTSSDASQWLSSSFTTIPDDNKLENQTAVQTTITEVTTTVTSTDHEPVESEVRPTSASKKKKKPKPKSSNQEPVQQSEVVTSSPPVEEPKVPTEPVLPPVTKTITTTIRPKVVTPPEQEDDDGFQVVRYRKHIPSVTPPEKTASPSSSLSTSRQSFTSDKDRKIVTPATTTKSKKDKKETAKFDVSLSSPSTDTEMTSSSSLNDSSKVKHIEQKTADQRRKSDEITQSQDFNSLSSLESASLPSFVIEEVIEQPIPLSSSSVTTESRIQSEPVLPPIKPPTTTLRVKASTSPEEEEEDNEGFQVVRYRKRIASAPRLNESLPPLPTKTPYRQSFGSDKNLRSSFTHSRQGTESRSMPRSSDGGQMPSNKRQQNRI